MLLYVIGFSSSLGSKEKVVEIDQLSTKGIVTDALILKNSYTTSITPDLATNVPLPLEPSVVSKGEFSNQLLEGYPNMFVFEKGHRHAVSFSTKVPNGWKTNSPFSVRLHFTPYSLIEDTKPDIKTIDLRLWYKIATIGSTFNSAFENIHISKDVPPNSENEHLTAVFPQIPLYKETDQTILLFVLERNSLDLAVDTYPASIIVLHVEVLFEVNKLGIASF